MKVSILVPVYKVEKYIEECARSLFEQTFDNIEYVFVDDCSPDNSIEILKRVINEYPKRLQTIKIIRNEVNKGIGETRGILLDNASGDFVLFVDSDDYIDRNAVETFVRTVQSTDADIVRANFYNVINGQVTKVYKKAFSSKENLLYNTLMGCDGIAPLWILFMKRKLTINPNIIRPAIDYCEDYILSIQLFYYAHKIVHIDDAFYYYRQTGNIDSITHHLGRVIKDKFIANDTIKDFLDREGIYRKYEQAFLYHVFSSKQMHLVDKRSLDINLYMSYHPEVNSLWRGKSFGRRENLLFWLAEKKLTFIIKLLYKL